MRKQNYVRRGRKKKGNIARKGMLLLGLAVFFVLLILGQSVKQKQVIYSDTYIRNGEIPILLNGIYYNKEEWKEELQLDEDAMTSYGDVANVLHKLGVFPYITYETKSETEQIERTEWNGIYEQILDLLDTENSVQIQKCLILNKEDGIKTSIGKFGSEIETDQLKLLQGYELYVQNDSVIGVKGECDEEMFLYNTYIKSQDLSGITFLTNRETYYKKIDSSENVAGCVCDLGFIAGEITAVRRKADSITGKMEQMTDQEIQIEGYGKVQKESEVPVYKVYDEIEEVQISDLVLEDTDAEYIVGNGKVCAILLKSRAKVEQIRIALLNTAASPYWENVFFSSDVEFTLEKNGVKEKFAPNTVVNVALYLADAENGKMKMKSNDENGRIYLTKENGEKISLGYQGELIGGTESDGITVINDVPLETYLMGVVPSEMPSSYPLEALKAQAVCARSYVYHQVKNGTYTAIGAHIDDSVNFQVYNQKEASETSNQAVAETQGEVLTCNHTVVESNYFSTSWGCTKDGSIWEEAEQTGVLESVSLKKNEKKFDYSQEERFSEEIKENDGEAYDAAAPYYRWTANLSMEHSQELLTQAEKRRSIHPDQILYQDLAGNPLETTESFGALKEMHVLQREKSGCIEKIQFVFEQGRIEVAQEYNIRSITGQCLENILLADGTETSGNQIMPSAFFTLEAAEHGYVVYGGGYGHGIGMSQNGAAGMAEQGISYQKILQYFYQNVKIEQVGNILE